MPYTIGDRSLTLTTFLTVADRDVVVANQRIFQFCLVKAVLAYLEVLTAKVVPLHTDMLVIYASLLNKVTGFDDITQVAAQTKNTFIQLEQALKSVAVRVERFKQQPFTYNEAVRPFALKVTRLVFLAFQEAQKLLEAIEFFFRRFDNLTKLIMPMFLGQTRDHIAAFRRTLTHLETPLDFSPFFELTESTLNNLRLVERVTTGIECDTQFALAAFVTYNVSISHYTKQLLGQAILHRDIPLDDCGLGARRAVCYEATGSIGGIPLVSEKDERNVNRFLWHAVLAIIALVSVALYRFLNIIKQG